jgi:hypothetical protein
MCEIAHAGASDMGAYDVVEEASDDAERRVIRSFHQYARAETGYAQTNGSVERRQEPSSTAPAYANLFVRSTRFGAVGVYSKPKLDAPAYDRRQEPNRDAYFGLGMTGSSVAEIVRGVFFGDRKRAGSEHLGRYLASVSRRTDSEAVKARHRLGLSLTTDVAFMLSRSASSAATRLRGHTQRVQPS